MESINIGLIFDGIYFHEKKFSISKLSEHFLAKFLHLKKLLILIFKEGGIEISVEIEVTKIA